MDTLPGWRIEQKYNKNCLIGNWNENRRKFQRAEKSFELSTHQADYIKYINYTPENQARQLASMKSDGLPKEIIFSHHGSCYSNNMISWYDQCINNREERESTLPKLRTWDGKTTSWVPEKSDKPLQGHATNYGLLEQMKAKWQNDLKNLRSPDSTYKSSFHSYPNNAMALKRYATRKKFSSHFPNDQPNKDLFFRNKRLNLAPEHLPCFEI